MKIRAGDQIITVRDIYGENAHYDGKSRSTLRVSTDTPLTETEIAALLANGWEVIDIGAGGEDYVVSTHRGYGTVYRHQAVFVQTETAEEREAALRQRIAELEAQNQEAAASIEAVTQELSATKAVMPIHEPFTTLDTKKGE